MKKLFIAAMMLAVAAATPAFAQDTNAAKPAVEKKCDKKDCNHKCGKDRKGKVAADRQRPASPFDNLGLSDQQKTQLRQLQKDNFSKEARKAERQATRQNYLNGVKQVLTPDQYILFLETSYINAPQNRPDRGKMLKGADKNPKMKKGPRPEKAVPNK